MLEKINGIQIALGTIKVSGRQDINTIAGIFCVLDELAAEAAKREETELNDTENQQGNNVCSRMGRRSIQRGDVRPDH